MTMIKILLYGFLAGLCIIGMIACIVALAVLMSPVQSAGLMP